MHLSYDIDYETLSSGKRGELLEQSLTRLRLQNREGELVLATGTDELGESLLRFAQALIHVSDLDYLSQERVVSTFVEDLKKLLRERFAERAHLDYNDPERDPKHEYPIDCLINQSPRSVAVFAVLNDDRCRDATITLQQFRAWGRELFSAAVFDDQEKINRRVLARFSSLVLAGGGLGQPGARRAATRRDSREMWCTLPSPTCGGSWPTSWPQRQRETEPGTCPQPCPEIGKSDLR